MYFSVFNWCKVGGEIALQFALFFLLSSLLLCPAFSESQNYTTVKTARFTLHIDRNAPFKQKLSPDEISESAISILNKAHSEITKILDVNPQKEVILRFLSPKEFQRQTGAPAWTSAMFFKNEITIPLSSTGVDQVELERALRHEYVHAVIAEVSNFRGPAWLDEGVAQIIEGEVNPLLGPALRKWLIHNDPIPLDWLHGGFTMLEDELVPAAYAQSLFASRLLVKQYGFKSVTKYFSLLAEGYPEFRAFEKSFGINKKRFEKSLSKHLMTWLHSGQTNP